MLAAVLERPCNVLLLGPPGTAKSKLARRLAPAADCLHSALEQQQKKTKANGGSPKSDWSEWLADAECEIGVAAEADKSDETTKTLADALAGAGLSVAQASLVNQRMLRALGASLGDQLRFLAHADRCAAEQAVACSYVERLLTDFTEPDELFGPLRVSALGRDRYQRLLDGYIGMARVVFLDEIFKAGSASM